MMSSFLVLVSGEGPTDIGEKDFSCVGICAPGKWKPGPMALFVDAFIKEIYGFSPMNTEPMWFGEETTLSLVSKNLKPMSLGSNMYFVKNARALFAIARKLALQKNEDVLPVLFRDADGTHSSNKSEYSKKCESIAHCLYKDDYGKMSCFVCPMVPKPKSEAWLLCALQNSYHNCESLEALPGNDKSPKSAKQALSRVIGCGARESIRECLVRFIENEDISPCQIKMPSLELHKQYLKEVRISRSDIEKILPKSQLTHFKNAVNNVQLCQ